MGKFPQKLKNWRFSMFFYPKKASIAGKRPVERGKLTGKIKAEQTKCYRKKQDPFFEKTFTTNLPARKAIMTPVVRF